MLEVIETLDRESDTPMAIITHSEVIGEVADLEHRESLRDRQRALERASASSPRLAWRRAGRIMGPPTAKTRQEPP